MYFLKAINKNKRTFVLSRGGLRLTLFCVRLLSHLLKTLLYFSLQPSKFSLVSSECIQFVRAHISPGPIMLFPVLRDHKFHCRSAQTANFLSGIQLSLVYTPNAFAKEQINKSVQLFHAAKSNVCFGFFPLLGFTEQVSSPTCSR